MGVALKARDELFDLLGAVRAAVEDAEARRAIRWAGTLSLPEPERDAPAGDPPFPRVREVEPPAEVETPADPRQEAASCNRCGLAATRRWVVVATGPPRARLVVIAPPVAFADERDRINLSGEPGVMFERMLTGVLGLTRQDVVVVSALQCRTPEGRAPQPAELAACRAGVMAQVVAADPEVVLVFGEQAHASLFGPEPPLKRVRGLWREHGGRPTLATWSPQEILRSVALKRETFEDLLKVKAALS